MSAYHQLLSWPLVLQIDYVSPDPKTIIFIQFISTRVIRICVTKGVQLSLVRPTKACFGWISSNCWIFHHSSSFLMTLGPSSYAFVSFLTYHWLFNVAMSFVNGPLIVCVCISVTHYVHAYSSWWLSYQRYSATNRTYSAMWHVLVTTSGAQWALLLYPCCPYRAPPPY